MTDVQWFYDDGGSRKGPLSDGEMKDLVRANKIGYGTSVWRNGLADWMPCEQSELKETLASVPPPLKRGAILDFWLWLLAISPLGWLLIDTTEVSGWFVLGWIVNITLCALDARQIKAAGYPAPIMWWSLLIPGYLFKRSRLVRGNQAPLIVWLVLFIAPAFLLV